MNYGDASNLPMKLRQAEEKTAEMAKSRASRTVIMSTSTQNKIKYLACLLIFILFLWSFAPTYSRSIAMVYQSAGEKSGLPKDRPLVIAHRGSSGMRPEHTAEAYQLAVDQGADIIECDVAVTKDFKLICTHDAWINATTDVHQHPEFADRVRTYDVPTKGDTTDYFTIDFTLEELLTLRKIQDRSYRDQSYNGQFPMATFDEYVAIAQSHTMNRTVGIYPESKTPQFFNNYLTTANTSMEDIMLAALKKHGYTEKDDPCFVQSFSLKSLRYFSERTNLPLVLLIDAPITEKQMQEYSSFITGLGPPKTNIVTVNPLTNKIIGKTTFLETAKKYNFVVHPYTFRNEYQFLAFDYGADPYREYEIFVKLGVNGLFTDFPWSFHNYLSTNTASNISKSIWCFVLTIFTIRYLSH